MQTVYATFESIQTYGTAKVKAVAALLLFFFVCVKKKKRDGAASLETAGHRLYWRTEDEHLTTQYFGAQEVFNLIWNNILNFIKLF